MTPLPSPGRAALTDLVALPLERAPSLRLIPRCWELRDNRTVYDAAYVGSPKRSCRLCSLPAPT